MRDGAEGTADPSARSSVNSYSRRRVEGLRPPKAFSWRRYAIARVRNDRLISREGACPNIAFQRSRSSSIPSFDRLAISDAKTLTILGAGVQGKSHLATVPLTRDFTAIRIASRDRDHAAALASTDPRCVVIPSFEEAIHGADVVCCCTDAADPITRYEWFDPGTHVTSVGGTFGPELDAETIRLARVFVEWNGAAQNPPPAGAHELQGIDPAAITEIGEVIAGLKPGRESSEEITVYKSTGSGFEDAVVAQIVYRAALEARIGTEVEV